MAKAIEEAVKKMVKIFPGMLKVLGGGITIYNNDVRKNQKTVGNKE